MKTPEEISAYQEGYEAGRRAALPAEPPDEILNRMQFAFGLAPDQPWRSVNAYRALRADLLGEDAC